MHYASALRQDTRGLYDVMPENGADAIDTRTGLNYTPLCLRLYRPLLTGKLATLYVLVFNTSDTRAF